MERSILTIGITAFNSGSYLQDAIDSVLEQNNAKWKGVLVLDGGADWKTKKYLTVFNIQNLKNFNLNQIKGHMELELKQLK